MIGDGAVEAFAELTGGTSGAGGAAGAAARIRHCECGTWVREDGATSTGERRAAVWGHGVACLSGGNVCWMGWAWTGE